MRLYLHMLVLYKTSQQIVSGKDSPVIRNTFLLLSPNWGKSPINSNNKKGLFEMHVFVNMLWQLYQNSLLICRKNTTVMRRHKSSFSTSALRKCATRQKKAIRTKIYHLYQHLQSQREIWALLFEKKNVKHQQYDMNIPCAPAKDGRTNL